MWKQHSWLLLAKLFSEVLVKLWPVQLLAENLAGPEGLSSEPTYMVIGSFNSL